MNIELQGDGMCLAGTQVIQYHLLSMSSGLLELFSWDQYSASVLGINSAETKLHKSADLQLTKPIVNSYFICFIKKEL